MGFEYLFYNHPINDLELNKYGVWIASRTGIYIYDKDNPDWKHYKKFMGGWTDDPVRRKEDGHSEHSYLSQYR